MSTKRKVVLLYGIEDDLFKKCFGMDEEWSACVLESLRDDCAAADLHRALCRPDLCCVVFMDASEHYPILRHHYEAGGFIVFFGIYGEFTAPNILHPDWRFSAYTRHEYELTSVGKHYLGHDVTTQQYTKCNLVSAPEGHRIMIPKMYSFEEYLKDHVGLEEEDIIHPEMAEEVNEYRERYPKYIEELSNQSPLVVCRNENGGRIAYLGFVNGDGNIPKIVRALLCGCNISKSIIRE